jgi:hypothetical protein
MNVPNKSFFCKPFVCGCKDFVRGKEGERLLKRRKWLTILGRRRFLFVAVTEEEHWMDALETEKKKKKRKT